MSSRRITLLAWFLTFLVAVLFLRFASGENCYLIPRDHRGRIRRSEHVVHEFYRISGHPHGWPGHVADHVCPLECGGRDAEFNLQWQDIKAAAAKDKWEGSPAGCRKLCNSSNWNGPPCSARKRLHRR